MGRNRQLTNCAERCMSLSAQLMRVGSSKDPEEIRWAVNKALEIIADLKRLLPNVADRLVEMREEAIEKIIKKS